MTPYLVAVAVAVLFPFVGIAAISRQERRRAATRPIDRAQQDNPPQPALAAHIGDFSALAAGSIEGVCSHV